MEMCGETSTARKSLHNSNMKPKLNHPTSLSTTNRNLNFTGPGIGIQQATLAQQSISYSPSNVSTSMQSPQLRHVAYNGHLNNSLSNHDSLSPNISPPSNQTNSQHLIHGSISNNSLNSANPNSSNSLGTAHLAHNSRSFGDINEVNHSANMVNGTTPTHSLSPSSSIATTPTHPQMPSSFLRIFIGTSTAVIEKKPIPLKDALSSKLKSRNLEMDKCIAYIKDSK